MCTAIFFHQWVTQLYYLIVAFPLYQIYVNSSSLHNCTVARKSNSTEMNQHFHLPFNSVFSSRLSFGIILNLMYSLQNSAQISPSLLQKIQSSFPLIHTSISGYHHLCIVYELVDVDNQELSTKLGLSIQVNKVVSCNE